MGVAPIRVGTASIYVTAGWYVVWYWLNESTYTQRKFDDFEDAMEFAKEHSNDE